MLTIAEALFKYPKGSLKREAVSPPPCHEEVLLMRTIFHEGTFSLQAAISVRVINTSPPSPAAMFGTLGELDQNSTLGCW